ALDFVVLLAVAKFYFGPIRREIMHTHVVHFEIQRPAVGETQIDEVLHHFLLAVDRNSLVDELLEIDPVQFAVDADVIAPVHHTFALEAVAGADVGQEVDRPMLDQAGADAVLDVLAAAVLDDDRVDALQGEQVSEHQPRRACSDNPDLGAHRFLPPPLLQSYRRGGGTG